MHARRVTYHSEEAPDALTARFAEIRSLAGVSTEFPRDVLTAAAHANIDDGPRDDDTDLPVFTLDPAGAKDLDQAMHLAVDGDGYRIRYAIADIGSMIVPGGVIDHEARLRGVTVYCPDIRVPLHPPILSEGAASLLPNETRAAYLWDIRIDRTGTISAVDLRRTMVRSRARLSYGDIRSGRPSTQQDEQLRLLEEIGGVCARALRERGGSSLPALEQEVVCRDGAYTLTSRPHGGGEEWNAQISLLTGMAAASIMIDAGAGILRTMPAPSNDEIERLRAHANAKGLGWAPSQAYGDFLRGLRPDDPAHRAVIHEAGRLFRGAGYSVIDASGTEPLEHAAVAAPYAHVTAPLRRLVDRFTLAICAAHVLGEPIPAWVGQSVPTLTDTMTEATRRAAQVEHDCINAVEAALLSDHVGSTLPAVVVDADGDESPLVHIDSLTVVARATGTAQEGQTVSVRVDAATIADGTVELTIVEGAV